MGILALLLAACQKTETVTVPETTLRVEMVHVPGGTAAGLEVRPFWISTREVTWDEFTHYYDHLNHFRSKRQTRVDGVTRPSQPHEPPDGRQAGWEADRHPVINVKWHSMMAYCDWLSKKTGRRFRLPTEAEWEVAARAGSAGAAPAAPADLAWYQANSGRRPRPAGGRKPNAWGLHDMLGNVWEMTLEFAGKDEPEAVLRGGAWNSPAEELGYSSRKVAEKEWSERDSTNPKSLWWFSDAPFVGFRVASFVEPGKDGEAYAARVEVTGLSVVKPDDPVASFAKASATVTNRGDRAVEELELLVYFLDDGGKPLLADPKGRATFIRCYPVLANSARAGEHRRPLKAGEGRKFDFFIPHPRDEAGPLDYDKLGAEVSALQLAR